MSGNSPLKSMQLRFEHTPVKIDISIWEGLVREGKPMPSNISIRLVNEDSTSSVIYLNQESALQVANVLQQMSFNALEYDSKRRLEAWKMRQGSSQPTTASKEGKEEAKE